MKKAMAILEVLTEYVVLVCTIKNGMILSKPQRKQ